MDKNYRQKINAHHDCHFGLNYDKRPKGTSLIKLKINSSGRLEKGLFFTKYTNTERAENRRFQDFCASIADLDYHSLSQMQFREVNEIHKLVSGSGINNRYSIPAIIEYLCVYGKWNQSVLSFSVPDLSKRKINADWVKKRLENMPINTAPILKFSDTISKDR